VTLSVAAAKIHKPEICTSRLEGGICYHANRFGTFRALCRHLRLESNTARRYASSQLFMKCFPVRAAFVFSASVQKQHLQALWGCPGKTPASFSLCKDISLKMEGLCIMHAGIRLLYSIQTFFHPLEVPEPFSIVIPPCLGEDSIC